MKLAYTICTPDTKGKYLAYRGELKEMFASLKGIGYQGVEAFVRDPREMDQDEFCRMLMSYDLELAAVGTGPIVAEDKIFFTSSDEGVRNEAVERTKAAVDFAARLGAQVNIGKLRGNVKQGDQIQAEEWRDQAFKIVCQYAALKNVTITLEPQCRFAIDNLNSTQEALVWVKQQQLSNLFIMMDVFHMNIEDKSQAASFIEAKDYNFHMHFADNNRGVPGTSKIDFVDAVRVLKALGYNRYISMEIDQLPDCYSAAKASFDYVNWLIKEG
ncbi:sugar phosphate isomerase/epimerase family protein [Desulfosporosinus shakirovi]|uniref:sugar phosphate isomerase/epimerase family protein n=1 Tax=Desulfosporosinus shakirovi TaxID=2885154 RepID=UPI001E4C59E7|nr:sugar phosphate isomerase/epimerase family protein [Desulfosporosinus sp. SRJS8]MCB8815148.1 sugar phosphate isomerase/epimerase [Desulfosporosinus sp. SRJS8]